MPQLTAMMTSHFHSMFACCSDVIFLTVFGILAHRLEDDFDGCSVSRSVGGGARLFRNLSMPFSDSWDGVHPLG